MGDPTSVITRGSLRAIAGADNAMKTVPEPIMQCVQIKLMPSQNSAPDRYRVVLSDMDNFIQTMLGTQKSNLVVEGKLKKGVIVRLKQYQAQTIKGKKILILLDLDVLEEYGEHDKLGQPQALPLEDGTEEGSSKPADQQQPGNIAGNNFYGNKPAPAQQPKSMPSRSGGQGASGHANLYPIEALSPYAHKWTIKVRCTHKSDIKQWHNKNGEGKLFSVTFLDHSGEIRGTGFNEQCDQLYDVFQENGIYYISSPCRVTMAKKQFSNVNNDYELMFERDTQVEKAEDQESDVPQVRYNFTNIGDLQNVEKDTTIDTIGILKDVGEVSQITSKTTSKPYDKRELTLVDNTGYSVRLTIWGASATTFDAPEESVIAFKGVKVSDFGGRSLSLLSSGSMTVDPDIDDAHRLKGWYDAAGRSENYATHAAVLGSTAGARKDNYKTIAQVKDEHLGMGEEADYFTLKATVVFVRQESFAYPACSSEGCNKKVVETDPGQWRCERCDKTHPRPLYRYIMSINVSDHTGQIWLSSFDETGRLLMGRSADEMMQLKEDHEKAALEAFSDATCRTYVFRCRAKMDNFQDQQRVRYQISSAAPVNFSAEAARLTELIKQYNIGDTDPNSMFMT